MVAWQHRLPGDSAQELVPQHQEGTCTGTRGDMRQMAGPPPDDAIPLFKHSGERGGGRRRPIWVPEGHHHQEHLAKSQIPNSAAYTGHQRTHTFFRKAPFSSTPPPTPDHIWAIVKKLKTPNTHGLSPSASSP